MAQKKISSFAKILAAFSCALLLVSCDDAVSGRSLSFLETEDSTYIRPIPTLLLSTYSGENQIVKEDGERSAIIDLSNISKGYIAVTTTSPTRAKLLIEKDGNRYQYDKLSNVGEFEIFPLTLGDGVYTINVYLNLPALQTNEYERFLTTEATVSLESEFAPFLVPSQIVNYDASSEAVAFSYELARHSKTDTEVVAQVYAWIASNITYDTSKAENINSIGPYVPDPDDTLSTRTGICYDYASLAAAMLRANGIPCQLVKGDVSAQDGNMVYHAWNNIWLKEGGMITVKISAPAEEWMRIDLTFAASNDSQIGNFIGNSENYYPFTVF